MTRVHLEVDVSPELLHRFEEEAHREGDTTEHLLEHTVEVLLHELDDDEPPTDIVGGVS